MVGRRVLLVDDHATFRESAGAWLVREGFDVVGTSENGEGLQATIEAVRPDIVLLDVNLPGRSGPEVAAMLPRTAGAPDVILISGDDDAASDPRVLEAPVAGFLAKRDLSCAAIDALLC
jgi:DNA-binding NarL/FixJ family response regulator